MLVFVVFAACASNDEFEVNRANCERYRDHLVDLRLRDSSASIDVRAHSAAMKQALGERVIDACEHQFSSPQLRCALRADDFADATACTRSASK
jgi:hypothetical protein